MRSRCLGARGKSRQLGAIVHAVTCVVMCASSAQAQNSYINSSNDWNPCRPVNGDHFVYFNAGDLSDPSRGYNVSQFRAALIRAIAVWNEESLSGQRMIFMGDGIAAGNPTNINVNHVFKRSCAVGSIYDGLAITLNPSGGGSGGTCSNSTSITVHLTNCSQQELRYSAGLPGSMEYSYEAVLIHELGHAAFGFPDLLTASQGVMSYCNSPSPPYTMGTCGGIPPGPVGDRLHLHRIDQQTAVDYFGSATTAGRSRVLSSTNSWLGAESVFQPTTTFGPSLTTRLTGGPTNGVLIGSTNTALTFSFHTGSPGSWAPFTSFYITPSAVSSGVSVRPWISIAKSSWDELAAAWMECTSLTVCNVRTAWRASTGSWQVSPVTIAMPVTEQVEIEYDPDMDYFVMFSIHPDGRIFQSYEAAWQANNWTTPIPLDGYNGYNSDRRFRTMGGVVFYQHPGTARGDFHGRLFAASSTPVNGATSPIMAFDIGYDNSTFQYRTSALFFPGPAGQENQYNTIRNFSVRRESSSNVVVAAWTDDQFQSHIRVARTPNSWFSPLGSTASLSTTSSEPVHSSVSLANITDNSSQFVVGWSSR